jgi:hypothetical protein
LLVKLIVSPTHALRGAAVNSAIGAWARLVYIQNKPVNRREINLSIV